MSAELEGRIALVTGAATVGALGWETARVLAQGGARVVIGDLDATRVDDAAARLRELGLDVWGHPVDITDEAQVKTFVAAAADRHGAIDILDNNAGITALAGRDAPIAEAALDQWRLILDINVCGTMLMCKHVLPHMLAGGRGSIINISSLHGLAADGQIPAYSASKAAVLAITRDVATAYGTQGIRCNAITPGCIGTAENLAMPAELQRQIAKGSVLGRLGDPIDIANTVAFLASDRSTYITGHTIAVDGGMLIHTPTVE